MEVALEQGQYHPHLARVTKLLKDKSGNPIGKSHDNPILDCRIYEVEFSDVEKMSLTVITIAENMFDQVDEQGHRHVIMDEIIDNCTDGNQVSKEDAFVTLISGAKQRKETTKVWQVFVQWKYFSTTWNELKVVK